MNRKQKPGNEKINEMALVNDSMSRLLYVCQERKSRIHVDPISCAELVTKTEIPISGHDAGRL